jgi:hypothetical protein
LVTAFDVLAKKQIGLLKEPSLDCVRFVVKELQEIAGSSLAELQGDIARFPKLRREIGQVFKDLLKERVQLSNGLVKNLLVSEFGLKTSHPEFYKKAVTMLNERDQRGLKLFGVKISTQKSARRVEKECVLVENLIGEGFQNVRKTVQEYVTKIIANTLIDYLRENLESQLVTRLGKPEKIEEVMVDENLDRDLCVEREKTAKLVKVRFY